jgi:hypothetical protein
VQVPALLIDFTPTSSRVYCCSYSNASIKSVEKAVYVIMLGIKMNAWSWIIVGGIIVAVGGVMVGYGWHIMPKKGKLPEDRKQKIEEVDVGQGSGQQAIIANIRDSNISVVQKQGIDPCEYANTQKALGKTESELEKTKTEKQELQDIVNACKREDKEFKDILKHAENEAKTKIIVRVFQEHDKGSITREETLKLTDMVNRTPWEDLKSFLENKNIQIDKHNQSLVVSGIFMTKIHADDGYRARYSGPPTIVYVLTPEGDKLYEIAKTVNLE